MLKLIYHDENECINGTLSPSYKAKKNFRRRPLPKASSASCVIHLSFGKVLLTYQMTIDFFSICCPKTTPTTESEALHMILKGKSQLGLCKISALINACFNFSNAHSLSLSMMKSLSLQRRTVNGPWKLINF